MQTWMSLLLFFIHYFHNDCHYAQALIEFRFVSWVCGGQNNYHFNSHAKHFHGQIRVRLARLLIMEEKSMFSSSVWLEKAQQYCRWSETLLKKHNFLFARPVLVTCSRTQASTDALRDCFYYSSYIHI